MPRCYVVPGFLETEITTPFLFTQSLLWVFIPRIILGEFGALRLAPNGTDPGPPDGLQCETGPGLSDYVVTPAGQLAGQLAGDDYTVSVFPWDWRSELYAIGRKLASLIAAENTSSDPCSIVAHSTGGLVARAAWTELSITNQQDLVRRIVTLGCPHYGSYSVAQLWSLDSPLMRTLSNLNFVVGYSVAARWPGYRRWTLAQIRDLTLTWPSLYELLPLIGVELDTDPHRPDLYQRSNWAGAAPQQQWLDYSRLNFGAWLRSPQSQPPAWVLTSVSGTDRSTAATLQQPSLLGTPAALGSDQGDGTVTQVSAELPGSTVVRTLIAHDDMFVRSVASGDLAGWILDPRVAPSPPPPMEVRTTLQPQQLYGPPLDTILLQPGQPAVNCPGRNCEC